MIPNVTRKFWKTHIWSWSKLFILMWILMEKKNSHKYKKPMKFFLTHNSKLTMIKIIIAWIVPHNLTAPESKLTVLNQNQDKQAVAILTMNIEHTPAKILMIISIITISTGNLLLRRNLKNKEKNNFMKMKKINKKKTNQNLQTSTNNKNIHVLKLHGRNFKEENNFMKSNNFVMRLHSNEKWEINWRLWEALHLLIMFYGPDIIFVMIILLTVHMISIKKNKMN